MNYNIEEINPAIAFERIQNGALLLDIREWEELEMLTFDIKEQLFIPLHELESRFQEVPMDREIIIGCNSGNRSLQAAFFLKGRNFEKVYNLQGGIGSWIELGLPVQWENFEHESAVRKDEIN